MPYISMTFGLYLCLLKKNRLKHTKSINSFICLKKLRKSKIIDRSISVIRITG